MHAPPCANGPEKRLDEAAQPVGIGGRRFLDIPRITGERLGPTFTEIGPKRHDGQLVGFRWSGIQNGRCIFRHALDLIQVAQSFPSLFGCGADGVDDDTLGLLLLAAIHMRQRCLDRAAGLGGMLQPTLMRRSSFSWPVYWPKMKGNAWQAFLVWFSL